MYTWGIPKFINMTTRFVGLKEFRQNIAKFSAEAYKKTQRLVILRKNQPIFEIRPLTAKQAFTDDLMIRLERAEEEFKNGKTYSQNEIEKSLGL